MKEEAELAPLQVRTEKKRQSDELFRLLVEGVQDYAIFLLDPNGLIMTWNAGAERIKGYKAEEIIGQSFERFYSIESRESGWPRRELEMAQAVGRFCDEGWRVRKDGTTFWASVVITALRSPEDGALRGFSKVTRDLTERRALEERTQELNKELRARMAQLSESRSQLEVRSLELQRLSGQLMRFQDDERRRIARDLHDDLAQELAALKMNLDSSVGFPSRDDAIELTESVLAKVRGLSYMLHPPLLDEAGLIPALHLYLEGLQKRGTLRIAFDVEPSPFPRLSVEIEAAIFRIIQEAVMNVQRHSQSPEARVELHQRPDRVFVRVRDFGIGMPYDPVTGTLKLQTGAGIGGLKERVMQLGGAVNIIRSEPGTLVEANIPLYQ